MRLKQQQHATHFIHSFTHPFIERLSVCHVPDTGKSTEDTAANKRYTNFQPLGTHSIVGKEEIN